MTKDLEGRSMNFSKNYYDDEIISCTNGILYLKQGVRRRPKVFYTDWDELEDQVSLINHYRKFTDHLEYVIQVREQERNYDE